MLLAVVVQHSLNGLTLRRFPPFTNKGHTVLFIAKAQVTDMSSDVSFCLVNFSRDGDEGSLWHDERDSVLYLVVKFSTTIFLISIVSLSQSCLFSHN